LLRPFFLTLFTNVVEKLSEKWVFGSGRGYPTMHEKDIPD
jgi:hypothetical protein